MSRVVLVVSLALALPVGGCAEHYVRGRQVRAYFVAQRVNPRGISGGPAGLDSEEASLIHARYRAAMSPEEAPAQRDQGADVLVIQQDQGGRRQVQEVSREGSRPRVR